MKKKIFIGVAVLAVVLLSLVAYVALYVSKKSPIKTTEVSNGDLSVKVVYCQPYKKGRLIFGEEKDKALQPYGKYWRLGANAATEITFNKPVNFGGKAVNAGTYRMYAIPGASSFQVALNSETGVYFGVNEPNYALDVVKVDAPVTEAAETEQFVINFTNEGTGINMDFVWDKTDFRVPITPQ